MREKPLLTLEWSALEARRIPQRYYGVTRAGLSPSGQDRVLALLERTAGPRGYVAAGALVLLTGGEGSGKTSAGVVLLKGAALWGISGLFVSVSDLREGLRRDADFSSDQSIAHRVRSVRLLLLDDLRAEDLAEKEWNFGRRQLEDLLRSRVQACLPTILTTRLAREPLAFLVSAVRGEVLPIPLSEGDRRQKRQEDRLRSFGFGRDGVK